MMTYQLFQGIAAFSLAAMAIRVWFVIRTDFFLSLTCSLALIDFAIHALFQAVGQ